MEARGGAKVKLVLSNMMELSSTHDAQPVKDFFRQDFLSLKMDVRSSCPPILFTAIMEGLKDNTALRMFETKNLDMSTTHARAVADFFHGNHVQRCEFDRPLTIDTLRILSEHTGPGPKEIVFINAEFDDSYAPFLLTLLKKWTRLKSLSFGLHQQEKVYGAKPIIISDKTLQAICEELHGGHATLTVLYFLSAGVSLQNLGTCLEKLLRANTNIQSIKLRIPDPDISCLCSALSDGCRALVDTHQKVQLSWDTDPVFRFMWLVCSIKIEAQDRLGNCRVAIEWFLPHMLTPKFCDVAQNVIPEFLHVCHRVALDSGSGDSQTAEQVEAQIE